MAEAAPQTEDKKEETGPSWTSILGNFVKGVANSALQVGAVALDNSMNNNWLPQAQVQQAAAQQQAVAQQQAAARAAGAPSSLARFAAPIAIGGGAILAAILVFRGKRG
jgi:hypothetical protein